MKNFLIIFLILAIACSVFLICPYSTYAETLFEKSLNDTAKGTGHESMEIAKRSLPEIIGIIIQAILAFLGVAFLILIIYGGYLWMLARGNEQQVEKAKNIIKNALIGLIVVLAAWAITFFLMSYFVYRWSAGLPEP